MNSTEHKQDSDCCFPQQAEPEKGLRCSVFEKLTPRNRGEGLGRRKEARRESQHEGTFSAGHLQLSPAGDFEELCRTSSELPTHQTEEGGLNSPVPTSGSSNSAPWHGKSLIYTEGNQGASVSSVPHSRVRETLGRK